MARGTTVAIAELKGRERTGLFELPPPFRRGDTLRATVWNLHRTVGAVRRLAPHERLTVLHPGRVELPKGDSMLISAPVAPSAAP
jgi:hypothetical protein